ncbi:hypothetical protein COO60DRAFT_1625539, partial [Scenedesmus sp. NREL 46B-D3]
MEQQPTSLDVPLIIEATKEFYRQVYGNNDLCHFFKVGEAAGCTANGLQHSSPDCQAAHVVLRVVQGINMVVLRRHVSSFILQLTAFDTPMTEPQVDYLRKVHGPVIEEHGATQRHFDMLVSLLISSLRSCGAQGTALLMMQSKLRPLRDIFPMRAAAACGSQSGSSLSSVDGTIVLQEGIIRERHAHHGKPQRQQQWCPQQRQQPQQQQSTKQLQTARGATSQVPLQAPAQQQDQQRQQAGSTQSPEQGMYAAVAAL